MDATGRRREDEKIVKIQMIRRMSMSSVPNHNEPKKRLRRDAHLHMPHLGHGSIQSVDSSPSGRGETRRNSLLCTDIPSTVAWICNPRLTGNKHKNSKFVCEAGRKSGVDITKPVTRRVHNVPNGDVVPETISRDHRG